MPPGDSFPRLMAQLRAGNDQAAAAVWQRFVGRLVALARSHLDERLRRREDPDDVAVSACKSFFLRYRAGKFDGDNYRFQSWDDVWSLLARITVCKCRKRAEHHYAQRRDVSREVCLGTQAKALERRWETTDPEPTPLEAALLAETIEQLLGEWQADQRAIIELTLQGYGNEEISVQLGRAERTVRRVREQLRKRLQRM